jgi:hypothetical protein
MGIAEDMESPQCVSCIWKNEEDFLCAAFPFGIPTDILQNKVLHNTVLDEQEGEFVYTKIKTLSK